MSQSERQQNYTVQRVDGPFCELFKQTNTRVELSKVYTRRYLHFWPAGTHVHPG